MQSNFSEKQIGRIFRTLYLIRRTEEEIARIYPSDKIKSPVHLSIGQEAVATGICEALRPDDAISPTYRCHAAYLAKGGDLNAMIAELYGKDSGCARGKGGSMHMVAMDRFILGASAVVGTTVPIAAGYALAMKREGKGRVMAAFFGDGATEEGSFYETVNFASLHKLPILFVCENNALAIHTPIEKRWATRQLCDRIRTFGIPAEQIASGDVFEIHARASESIAGIRRGEGPAFLECLTYRWREHVGPGEDYDAGYRDREELLRWQRTDPVVAVGSLLNSVERDRITGEVERELIAAFQFAEMAAWPHTEELYRYVFAE